MAFSQFIVPLVVLLALAQSSNPIFGQAARTKRQGTQEPCILTEILRNGSCVIPDDVCDLDESNGYEDDCPTDCSHKNQFLCSDGTCIAKYKDCDGYPHCPDGSDEKGCRDRSCGTSLLKCGEKGLCVPIMVMCDGTDNCGNGWDEEEENCKDINFPDWWF